MLSQVTVRRTDNNTDCAIHMRSDRLWEFGKLRLDPENLALGHGHRPQDQMPGISGMAALGLSTIFSDIPSKFPVYDLLKFLMQQADIPCLEETERLLEIMGTRFPGITFDGKDT